MAYEVLARKWRPQNFSELIGQVSVRKTLTNALLQKRLYPVLLFTGPRGTGKTSSARILAKTLRCSKQQDFIPCNQCEDCLLIQESRHLDVIEIDGASNNGVEAVRELKDTLSYLPSTGTWKIYIIDEVHMLSNSAFNALLKTLEEPPPHVLFVMATTESHKIPQTVLSRCQKLDFHLLSPSLIKEQLEKICTKESLSIEEGALWTIAKQAGGSLRDAQSLLDQMITFCEKKLTREKVTELLGLSDPQTLFFGLQALVHRKEGDMIELIHKLRTKGNEPNLFLQGLIEGVRNLLILKKNPDNKPPLVQASRQEIEEMKKEIKDIPVEDLHLLFDMLLKGEKEMALCYDSQLILEILLLRLCSAPRLESMVPLNTVSKEKKKITKPEKPSDFKPFSKEFEKKTSKTLSLQTPPEKSNSSQNNKDLVFSKALKPQKSLEQQVEKKEIQSFPFLKSLDFLKYLKQKDQSLSHLVEQLSLIQKSSQHFCFTVPDKFSYLYKKIKDPVKFQALERHLMEFLNFKDHIKVEILYSDKKKPVLKEEKRQKEEEELLQTAQDHSFVKEVQNFFQVEVKKVERKS